MGDNREIEVEDGLPINPTERGEPNPVGRRGLRIPFKVAPSKQSSSPFVLEGFPSARAISARECRVRSHCGCCSPSIVCPSPEEKENDEDDNTIGTKEGPAVEAAVAAEGIGFEGEEDTVEGGAAGEGRGTYKDPLLLLLKGEPPAIILRRSAKALSRSAAAWVSSALPIPPAAVDDTTASSAALLPAAPATPAVQACMTACEVLWSTR